MELKAGIFGPKSSSESNKWRIMGHKHQIVLQNLYKTASKNIWKNLILILYIGVSLVCIYGVKTGIFVAKSAPEWNKWRIMGHKNQKSTIGLIKHSFYKHLEDFDTTPIYRCKTCIFGHFWAQKYLFLGPKFITMLHWWIGVV